MLYLNEDKFKRFLTKDGQKCPSGEKRKGGGLAYFFRETEAVSAASYRLDGSNV